MADRKIVTILNLFGKTLGRLEDFLEKSETVKFISEPISEEDSVDIVILPKSFSIQDVKNKYSIINNNTQFLRVGQTKNIKEFIAQGGRHIQYHMDMNPAAQLIFEKHVLKKEMSMHFQDYFNEEYHSFSIVNHLMMGTVVDEMCSYVFDNELDIVAVRSCFDHLIYYIMYLKQAGLAGMPIECQYAIVGAQFVLRMQSMVQNFSIEHILNSFNANNEAGQVHYLLSAAAHSCQYMDITLLESPSKICFTVVFDAEKEGRSWGLSLNQIPFSSSRSKESENGKYQDLNQRMDRLSHLQDKLENEFIPNGFEDFMYELEESSVLKKSPNRAGELVDYMLDLFQQTYPDYELSQFSNEIFQEFVKDFPDNKTIQVLSENDVDYIVEQIQKNHIVEAFGEARMSFLKNDEKIKELQDIMGQEVARGISEYVDDNIINEILSLEDPLKRTGSQETIFGTFEPSVKNFNTKDAFANLSTNFSNPTAINLNGILDDFDPNLIDHEDKSISSWVEPDQEDFSFGNEDFENILPPILPAFTDNASEEMLRISGENIVDEFSKRIKSLTTDNKDDFIETFANSFNNNMVDNFLRVSDWKEDNIDFMQVVRTTMASSDKLSDLEQSVKSFIEKEAPWKLQKGLEQFARDHDLEFSALDQDNLSEFSTEHLPYIISELINNDESVENYKNELANHVRDSIEPVIDHIGPSRFQKKFKDRLEKKLKMEVPLERKGKAYHIPIGELSSGTRGKVIQQTMQEVFAEEFSFEEASRYEIEHKELRLIKELSKTLAMDEKLVRKIVKGASEVAKNLELEFVHENLLNDELWRNQNISDETDGEAHTVKTLEHKLKTVEQENNNLKTSLTEMQLKLATTVDSKDQFDKLLTDVSFREEDFFAEDQKKKLIDSLSNGDKIEESDILKIDKALERENELRENIHNLNVELKKEQIEAEKKETAFNYEISKYQKVMKNKDIVLEKVKESIRIAMDKKEKQMNTLKEQVEKLNAQVKDLGGEPGLVRRDDKEFILAEELKNLKKSKEALEKRIETEIDAHEETEEKYHEAKSIADSAKKKLLTLETELNTTQAQLKILKEQNTNLVQSSDSTKAISAEKLEKENDELKLKLASYENQNGIQGNAQIVSAEDIDKMKDKNRELNNKIKELVVKLKKAEKASVINGGKDSGGTAREKHLEKSMLKITNEVTKLRSEYAEKKKEALKYKTDLVGLTNKMTVMQQDIDRLNKQLSSARSKNKAA